MGRNWGNEKRERQGSQHIAGGRHCRSLWTVAPTSPAIPALDTGHLLLYWQKVGLLIFSNFRVYCRNDLTWRFAPGWRSLMLDIYFELWEVEVNLQWNQPEGPFDIQRYWISSLLFFQNEGCILGFHAGHTIQGSISTQDLPCSC